MGEYISREAALKLSYSTGKRPTYDNPCGDLKEVVDVADIENIPAADVRPVVRGEWVVRCEYHLDYVTGEADEEFYLECSVCHRKVWDVSQDALIMGNHQRATKDYPFCHCGADMRGKPENA